MRSNELEQAAIDGAAGILARLADVGIGLDKLASVIDFGCGGGIWLAACEQLSKGELLGIDIARPRHQPYTGGFIEHDVTHPLKLNRRFDIALSLEVAEHLDGGERAVDTFIDNISRHAEIVIFSAAIPGQGGEHHVNEQWPEYWAHKFRRRGYIASDCLRPLIWLDERVAYWYRQNMIVYHRAGSMPPRIFRDIAHPVLPLVHPETWARR